jgi:O-acetyl-ADP-ribose deacetylase (regulator of RNase III)
VYGYPIDKAAAVAVATLRDELVHAAPLDITLCCFNDGIRIAFQQALDAAPHDGPPSQRM